MDLNKQSDLEKLDKQINIWRWLVPASAFIAILIFSLWFGEQNLSTDSTKWGAFGDFIGGIINPLIAFAAFYWLTVSVAVQKRELSETKQALKETANAQHLQAKLSVINSEIELNKQRLNIINTELQAKLNYRYTLQSMGNNGKKFYDSKGQSTKSAGNSIKELEPEIEKLTEKQEQVLFTLQSLVKDIKDLEHTT